jgi:hypothetical protein
MTSSILELSSATDFQGLLDRFYHSIYVFEFPDSDERESLDNMKEYLRLKADGWYGKNNYHILIADGPEGPCAGSISDFLAGPNAGVIEFLVVGKNNRGRGTGKRLLDRTEQQFVEDAAMALGQRLGCVVAEMNDPFKPGATADNLDPFLRAAIWHKWGYSRLDFPYVQPALSEEQSPVGHLMLIAKAFRPEWKKAFPAQIVKSIVHEYIRWAMRIDRPFTSPEYQRMAAFLDQVNAVPLQPLGIYIGNDPARPLVIRDVAGASDADFDRALVVYKEAFPEGPTAVNADAFLCALAGRTRAAGQSYHLWAIRSAPQAPVEGIASFFTFAEAGFGGYVALSGSLQHTGRFGLLLARIEEQILRDNLDARGWYIECHPDQAALFRKHGFYRLAFSYRPPPLGCRQPYGVADAPPLVLMYKDFGRHFGAPRVETRRFLSVMAHIYQTVYAVDPSTSLFFADLRSQAERSQNGAVPFST